MRQVGFEERYVDVHGRRLWVHQAGQGSPTVVFVPGGGGIGLDFAPTHRLITPHVAAVLYDRAGTGLSEDAALPRSAAEVVDELRTLLSALGSSGPYVLVGHSLGGAYVQRFAQLYPDEVAGLVLLDPAHEDFDDHVPEHLRITTRHGELPDAPDLTEELLELARGQIAGYVTDWPPPLREQVIALHTRPDRVLTGFHEGLNLVEVLTELRDGGPRPALPITVLTAAGIDPFQAAFTDEADLRTQIAGTERLADAIAATGRPGERRTFTGESHAGLPMRRPDAVAEAITSMLGRLRTG